MMNGPTTLRTHLVAMLLICMAFRAMAAPQVDGPVVIQEVGCEGNDSTSCEFIRDHLYLKPGQLLDEEEIRNAELRLEALSRFEAVSVRLERGAARGYVTVIIEVDEAQPLTMEWLVGATSRLDAQRGVVAARVAHENLFGEAKVADVRFVANVPVGGDAYHEAYDVILRYADPHLMGSNRYFAVASAGWRKRRYLDPYGNFGELETGRLDVAVGRRFADFSYFTVGGTYRSDIGWNAGKWKSDGTFVNYQPDEDGNIAMRLVYGWSTEDNLHFPTQGSTLQIIAGGDYEPSEPEGRQHFQFRKTWPMAGAYWTLKVGGDPSPEYRGAFGESQLLALTYSRAVIPSDEIHRGRWYLEPGFGSKGYTSAGETVVEYGLKAGFRAETRSFGLVDFYLLATRDTTR